MFRILVAEDDRELRELFCTVLEENKFLTIPACDGFDALNKMEHCEIDLIITDVMMPRMDGFELVELLRQTKSEIPVLMVTAKGESEDKCRGFSAGTDDYLVKPVDLSEMVWRVQALLRRSRLAHRHLVKIGSTTFDSETLCVSYGKKKIFLPQKEFYLLFKLVSYPNRIFTRFQIMDDVWGVDCETDFHTLEVHIGRLREKLKDNRDFEIVTVRGLGYKVATKNG